MPDRRGGRSSRGRGTPVGAKDRRPTTGSVPPAGRGDRRCGEGVPPDRPHGGCARQWHVTRCARSTVCTAKACHPAAMIGLCTGIACQPRSKIRRMQQSGMPSEVPDRVTPGVGVSSLCGDRRASSREVPIGGREARLREKGRFSGPDRGRGARIGAIGWESSWAIAGFSRCSRCGWARRGRGRARAWSRCLSRWRRPLSPPRAPGPSPRGRSPTR